MKREYVSFLVGLALFSIVFLLSGWLQLVSLTVAGACFVLSKYWSYMRNCDHDA